ncbi:rubrerythrin [Bradyrhizobium sp. USDA 4341]
MTCPTCQGDRFVNTNANSPDVPCPTCSAPKGPNESVLRNARTPAALAWVLREEIEISRERLHGLTLDDAAQEVADLDTLRKLLTELGGNPDEIAKIQADLTEMSNGVKARRRARYDEIHAQAYAEYEALKGKVVLLSEIECYDERSFSETVYCDPPAIARIVPYSSETQARQCIERWMDNTHCEPVFDIVLLEPHPAFAGGGLRPSWVFGTSYALDRAPPEIAKIAIADAATQAQYADASGLSDDECAPPPAPAP